MQTNSNVNNFSKVFSKNDLNEFNQAKETFHDIFQRTLKKISGSRPPKIELTGVLVPCNQSPKGYDCKFKLETDSKDYYLSMNDVLVAISKKMLWEEVIVKGFLDSDKNIIEVEKISLLQRADAIVHNHVSTEPYFELDQLRRTIAQRGKLDLDPEYLVS